MKRVKALLRFRDWPLRLKMAALLLVASVLPLAVVSLIEYASERDLILKSATALLAARGDQVAGELDAFHRAYQRSANRLALLPDVVRYSLASPGERQRLAPAVQDTLAGWQESDPNLRGIGILDSKGVIVLGTEKPLIGRNLGFHSYVQEALRGAAVISDLHFAGSEVGSAPTLGYLTPVKDRDGRAVTVVALWVRAASLWGIVKTANALAGQGSFAVMFDRFGVRIAHSYNEDIIFHPGGKLDAATVNAFVTERRFGEKTRELLEDARTFPDQFDRARSSSAPRREVFRGFAPVNQQWNYGVPRRLETVPWTLFYMVPEKWLLAPVDDLVKRALLVTATVILIALSAGMLVARGILTPIRALSEAAGALRRGDLRSRAVVSATDELGRLGGSFNTMADQLEAMIESEKQGKEKLQAAVSEYVTFTEKIGGGDLAARLAADATSAIGLLGVALNKMVERLAELTGEIRATATTLTSSISEILAATTQQATGVAEEVTAVHQTSTTVDELKQTAQVSAQKARAVAEAAQRTVQISQDGRKAVEESIQGTQEAKGRMEAIAQRILELSEQGQAIEEIIATVNDLTEQSNLLAVNAAIESARAGEAGKGFAVVAAEVKSLAEQSKQATAQVRGILNEIQRATQSAVMAAEQGVKSSEAGVGVAAKSGEAIRLLAESLTESAQAAQQILVTAQQQVAGMDQVALAMQNIQQASSQNMASTRQVERAAQDLNELAGRLATLVAASGDGQPPAPSHEARNPTVTTARK